jgi:hypothetical protein
VKRSLWSYLFPPARLETGDQIIYHKHWLILLGNIWKPLFFFLLLFVLIAVRIFIPKMPIYIPPLLMVAIASLWIVIDTLWLYWGYASWREDVYILDPVSVTDITRTPLLLRETRIQANLQQIQNVTSSIQNVWGQLFNFGSVIIQTAAAQGSMTFSYVENPTKVSEEILRYVQQDHDRRAYNSQQQQRQMMADYFAAQQNQYPPRN